MSWFELRHECAVRLLTAKAAGLDGEGRITHVAQMREHLAHMCKLKLRAQRAPFIMCRWHATWDVVGVWTR